MGIKDVDGKWGVQCRCMVYALSSGATHDVGIKDGFCCREWKVTGRIYSTATEGPSALLDAVKQGTCLFVSETVEVVTCKIKLDEL